MEFLYLLLYPLRLLFSVFPVVVALTLGTIFFGLSWVRPRRLVDLPTSGRRVAALAWIGIAGSATVLAVGTVTSWLPTLNPLENWGGWWQRPAPLVAAALVVIAAAVALRRDPLPAPGERAISPHRRWWEFAPRTPLWLTAITGSLLLLALGAMWAHVENEETAR